MKKIVLAFLILIFGFSSCELLNLEFKKVNYAIDSEKIFVFETRLMPSQEHVESRFIDREDFDIPSSAEIEKFIIQNIYLNFETGPENDCKEIQLFYTYFAQIGNVEHSSANNVFILLEDNPIGGLLMNDNFTQAFSDIRNTIELAIKADNAIEFEYKLRCWDSAIFHDTDIEVTIRTEVIMEYNNCEELPKGTDLDAC